MQRSVLDTLVQSKPEVVTTSDILLTREQLASKRSTIAPTDASVQQDSAAKKVLAAPGREPKPKASEPAAAADQSGGGHTQRTVFVRGLPAGTSQQQLHAAMLNFGTVKSCRRALPRVAIASLNIYALFRQCSPCNCRLVMDPTLKKPKGTAFVEYSSGAGAKKAAAACKRHR